MSISSPSTIYLETPAEFNFRSTIYSHGWCELRPFEIDENNWTLSYVFRSENGGPPASAVICEDNGKLKIEIEGAEADHGNIVNNIRHLLRIDDDLNGLYSSIAKREGLEWVAEKGAGRLLRSPTVYEDLVKTICTTNCSWGLTKNMVTNLVEKLGSSAANGKKTFPTAEAMAGVSAEFYRDEIRAGYRSPYFAELAEAVASGKIDPQNWLSSDLPTPELKKEMKKIKGVGDYAAENLLKLVGRYDGLALDSWLRSQFYKKHNGEKACDDKKIVKHYNKFGQWAGLVIWCDMTEKWLV